MENYIDSGKVVIVILGWFCVLIAMILDLLSGYHRAKLRGELRTSYGLRRTVSKFILYYGALIIGFMMDIFIMYIISCYDNFIPSITYVSLLLTLLILIVECKSIFEKADHKHKKNIINTTADITKLVKQRNELNKLIDEFSELINNKKE